MAATFTFRAEVTLTDGDAAWHFVTVPEDVSDEVHARYSGPPRGFGAVRIHVTVGNTTWTTSMFPSRSTGLFFLPIKRAAREAEGLEAGRKVAFRIDVPDAA